MPRVSGRWFVVQHEQVEGPALIGEALRARGVEPVIVRVDLGSALPHVDEVAALVVMGGPMNALEDETYPFLADERTLIGACLGRDVPVLGVCLGAQLMAAALGAAVYRGPRGEVGAGTVTLTTAAADDGAFGEAPAVLPVVHWHHDTFDLPVGAVLLASSERYERQAFRFGRSYGLQFHVELGPADLEMLRADMSPERVPSLDDLVEIERVGRPLVERIVGRMMHPAPSGDR